MKNVKEETQSRDNTRCREVVLERKGILAAIA